MIDDILIEYMKKYIPKYIGNFSKAEIDGNLYIGVDDIGYIEGIPYFGELDTVLSLGTNKCMNCGAGCLICTNTTKCQSCGNNTDIYYKIIG